MEDSTLRDEVRAAEAEIAAGNPDQALARCQALQARYPRALVVQRLLGEVYLALRKPREALGALERALAGDPDDARACCARAIVHQIHGDSTAALAWYRRACEIKPDDAMLRSAYHELATHLNQPAYRPTSVGLARLYLRGDLFAHAQHEWEAILAQQPDRLDAQVGLAETCWRAGETQRAGEIAHRIVANIPSCVKGLLIVAALEHAAGNDAEAGRLLQRAAELDPERRTGRTLYADRFAAGDVELEALLTGQPVETLVHRVTASHNSQRPERAGIAEAPTAQVPAATTSAKQTTVRPTAGSPQPLPSTLPPAAQSDLREVGAFAQSRSTNIPPDFHQIFAETEFMLWGREDEGPAATGANQAWPAADPLDALERSRVDRFERSSVIVPPALATTEGTLEDTEARAALGWVRWLQAQGARPADAVMRPAASAVPPGTVEPQSEPQPDQSSISLREMFAELEPSGTGKSPVVDAAAMPLVVDAARSAAAPLSASAASEPDSSANALPALDHARSDGLVVEADPAVIARDGLDGAAGARRDGTASGALAENRPPAAGHVSLRDTAPPTQPDAPATTLEALERTLAASGFHEFEPQPGSLAALAAREPATRDAEDGLPAFEPPLTHASQMHAGLWVDEDADRGAPPVDLVAGAGYGEDSQRGDSAASSAHPSAGPDPVGDKGEAAAPDAEDYAARLQLARRLRREGRMEEALVEYHAVLKGSPDLLYELVGDLRDLTSTTEQPEIHRLLGDAYIREGDYLSALESYNRALALTQGQTG